MFLRLCLPVPPIDFIAVPPRSGVAERALGRLDGITVPLPSQELFLSADVRKEGVLSSWIEGTQSTLWDLLRYETDAQAGQPIDEIREVSDSATLSELERLGIVEEVTGRRRGRVFAYRGYLAILNEGMDPIAAG